jgi:hypothetical protein
MGGNAFLIYGGMSQGHLAALFKQRSIADRIARRPTADPATWTQIERDRRLITLDGSCIGTLPDAFYRDLERRFSSPWKSTEVMLAYLREAAMTAYLRGETRADEPPEWYVQLTFSGCAGLAEVSSTLAVHWAERWYADQVSAVTAKFFEPCGFKPNGRTEPTNTALRFVPIGQGGYGIIDPSGLGVNDRPMLDVDQWLLEANEEADPTVMLERVYAAASSLRSSESCHCQWCEPDLDPTALDQVAL